MKVPRDCGTCGQEIIYDIEGVNVFNPSELKSLDSYLEDPVKEFGKELVLKTLDEVMEAKGNYKKVRFFEKCPRCGVENVFVLYSILM